MNCYSGYGGRLTYGRMDKAKAAGSLVTGENGQKSRASRALMSDLPNTSVDLQHRKLHGGPFGDVWPGAYCDAALEVEQRGDVDLGPL